MSGAEHFRAVGNNPYSHIEAQPDIKRAKVDFANIRAAVESAGVAVIKTAAPKDYPDGVYTANWALCRNNKAVMAALPGSRRAETPYAQKVLSGLGKEIIHVPGGLHFSGQGDALPCGNFLLVGSGYRTDEAVHTFLADTLGYEVVSLHTVPDLDERGQPAVNAVTGWPDSFFYDIDLVISVLRPDLVAWCPAAFVSESQDKIANLPLEKIEVSLEEAQNFGCNLISTGRTVVMSSYAPQLRAVIEAHGLRTITPEVTELGKGGGFIRCTTLTLDNE